jgi:hypothetical protein
LYTVLYAVVVPYEVLNAVVVLVVLTVWLEVDLLVSYVVPNTVEVLNNVVMVVSVDFDVAVALDVIAPVPVSLLTSVAVDTKSNCFVSALNDSVNVCVS